MRSQTLLLGLSVSQANPREIKNLETPHTLLVTTRIGLMVDGIEILRFQCGGLPPSTSHCLMVHRQQVDLIGAVILLQNRWWLILGRRDDCEVFVQRFAEEGVLHALLWWGWLSQGQALPVRVTKVLPDHPTFHADLREVVCHFMPYLDHHIALLPGIDIGCWFCHPVPQVPPLISGDSRVEKHSLQWRHGSCAMWGLGKVLGEPPSYPMHLSAIEVFDQPVQAWRWIPCHLCWWWVSGNHSPQSWGAWRAESTMWVEVATMHGPWRNISDKSRAPHFSWSVQHWPFLSAMLRTPRW